MICKHRGDLFNEVIREFSNNLLWDYIDDRYRESKYFRKAILNLESNICELNPTNKVGNIMHEFLKTPFFKKQEYRKGVYKEIKYGSFQLFGKIIKQSNEKKQKS